jgi:hypothetical protein
MRMEGTALVPGTHPPTLLLVQQRIHNLPDVLGLHGAAADHDEVVVCKCVCGGVSALASAAAARSCGAA